PPVQTIGVQAPYLPPKPLFQAKLRASADDDALEQEADRVADQIMRMPTAIGSFTAGQPQISCDCGAGEEEKNIKKAPASLQAGVGEAPVIAHKMLRSPGRPLDPAMRAYFEPRFARDFSSVRVHADARAAESARAVNARAYTLGSDIVFA